MQTFVPCVLLVDNSTAVTGAIKCALQQARLMQPFAKYIFVLPAGSTAIPVVQAAGYRVYALPMVELRKSATALLQYPIQLLRNSRRLTALVRAEGATAIVMNDYYNMLGAMVKKRLPHLRLFTFVRLQPSASLKVLSRLWLKAALKFADAIFAVSNVVCNQLPTHPKISLLYDAVFFDEQLPVYSVQNKAVFDIVYLANYIPGKGQTWALDAFAAAYQQNKNLRLHFWGGDMALEKNKAYKLSLQQQSVQSGLQDVVYFSGFTDDTETVLKGADIFLNCSESESFSMTCAEAGYYGVPTIATRSGGPEEIIVHEQTGVLVENKNVQQITDAILRLANDVNLRSRFSKTAKQYVQEKFGTDIFVAQFKGFLHSTKLS